MNNKNKSALTDKKMVLRAIKDSFSKLNPKTQAHLLYWSPEDRNK